MEQLSIENKIKLVAEWMGLDLSTMIIHDIDYNKEFLEETLRAATCEDLKYNSDWNELHEAWKKLYWKMMKEYPITGFGIKEKFGEACIKSDLPAAFECLVEGILLISKQKV